MSASQVSRIPRGEDYFSDSEESSAKKAIALNKSKWEGEDEEDDVLDSWDQEPEEDKQPEEQAAQPVEKSTKKNLKKLGDKFEEKERLKRDKLRGLEEPAKDEKDMTPDERFAEKLRRQQLQEEADLNLAKEVFGVGKVMESKVDFDKLKDDVLKVVQDSVKNANFVAFAEDLIQAICCVHLSSADIKRIHTKLGNLQIEKSKMEKGDKSKRSKGKAKIKVERDDDYSEFSAYNTEEFDDFI